VLTSLSWQAEAMSGVRKRPREEEEEKDPLAAMLAASEEYVPYVPLKHRLNGGASKPQPAGREEHKGTLKGEEDDEDGVEGTSLAIRARGFSDGPPGKKTLLDVQEELKRERELMDPKALKLQMQKHEEQRMLGEVCGHRILSGGAGPHCSTASLFVPCRLTRFSGTH
jgi:hypothetical protein